ncbi:HNH endonuclease [Fibrella sp. HMF5335]|uniref:HNH endonuclease n=1 Tax=Fibrella rubiginis TaxID=2817060 RepID=A0A939K5W6_9BACT|nr:HNH endonuclease signature motif containing protein [Fibrella rubiginis]MBO0936895.1 HNH endonuclease [Fibrella rubiginis]
MSRSGDYISAAVSRQVGERASFRCGYCLIAERDMGFSAEIDHIIALKHRGSGEVSNLAFSCSICNGNKGSDIASFTRSNELSRFYNPRTDVWSEHFRLDNFRIEPLTPIGEATEFIFRFNDDDRIEERFVLF